MGITVYSMPGESKPLTDTNVLCEDNVTLRSQLDTLNIFETTSFNTAIKGGLSEIYIDSFNDSESFDTSDSVTANAVANNYSAEQSAFTFDDSTSSITLKIKPLEISSAVNKIYLNLDTVYSEGVTIISNVYYGDSTEPVPVPYNTINIIDSVNASSIRLEITFTIPSDGSVKFKGLVCGIGYVLTDDATLTANVKEYIDNELGILDSSISNINSNVSSVSNTLGNANDLSSTNKSIVGAINELSIDMDNNNTSIGNIDNKIGNSTDDNTTTVMGKLNSINTLIANNDNSDITTSIDTINNVIGTSEDVDTTTVMGKLNSIEGVFNSGSNFDTLNIALKELKNTISGEASPYGTGAYGDVIVDSSFAYPAQDGFNRYVIHAKSFEVPEGITMKPPAKCDGLYILSQGDVTINGTIDLRGLRKTFGDVQMAPTINVGSRTFELAKGGYAPIGGASGPGTNQYYGGKYNTFAPAFTPQNSIDGNVNGGGVGKYGKAGISSLVYYTSRDYEGVYAYNNSSFLEEVSNTAGSVITCNTAPTSIVIIAKGNVTINGQIIASASSGKKPEDGGDIMYQASSGFGTYWHFSVSGDGAQPPSGGGCITIICNKFNNAGKLDTNGRSEKYSDGVDRSSSNCSLQSKYYIHNLNANNETETNDSSMRNYVKGGIGGKGGTFISTAGEIKVYEGVDE